MTARRNFPCESDVSSMTDPATRAAGSFEPSPAGSPQPRADPGQARILCLAGEALRGGYLRVLMSRGWILQAARSGPEALERLAADPGYPVFLCDSKALGDNGPSLLEAACRAAPDTATILLWDPSDLACLTAAVNRARVFRVLPAPMEAEELVRAVQEALERRRSLEQRALKQEHLEKENAALKRRLSLLEEKLDHTDAELKNARFHLLEESRKLKDTYIHMVQMFSNVLELYDPRAKSHGANVADLAARVGRALQLSPSELESLVVAGLFHDIGKMGLPDSVRVKPRDDLEPIEEALYRTHPIRGQMVFDSMEYMRDVGIVIRHHHESYTGGGFPDGLSGGQIPLASRIVALADAIDRWMEMETGDDPVAAVIERLRSNPEGRFDESLVPYFERSVPAVYDKVVPADGVSEREISLSQLRPGMILTRDIVSGTGITVAKKGKVLKRETLEKIRRCYEIDPPSSPGIAVWEGE